MSKSVRSQALSAIMRIFNKAALQAELNEADPKKPPKAKKPKLEEPAALDTLVDGVLSDSQ